MIPWLLICALLSESGKTLAEPAGAYMGKFPYVGEINYQASDVVGTIRHLRAYYAGRALHVDEMDGVGLELDAWRFNVRSLNMEHLLRLNIEAWMDVALLEQKIAEVSKLIQEY